jgi:hypothetical protein
MRKLLSSRRMSPWFLGATRDNGTHYVVHVTDRGPRFTDEPKNVDEQMSRNRDLLFTVGRAEATRRRARHGFERTIKSPPVQRALEVTSENRLAPLTQRSGACPIRSMIVGTTSNELRMPWSPAGRSSARM